MVSRHSTPLRGRTAVLSAGSVLVETLLELASLALLAMCLVGLALLRRRG